MRGQLRQISLRLSGARIGSRPFSSVTAGRPLHRGSFQDSTTVDIRSATRHPLDRRFASFKTPVTPVELAYDVTEPKEVTAPGQSLVVCHGLLGSKQNFRSLAKTFAQKLGMPVYTLDLRNHGSSPHVEPHSYEAMATDIAAFFEKHNLTSGVNLLGHSMGGKAVMALALNSELNRPLRSLISVDMSPAKGKISSDFSAYTETMIEIESAKVKSKAEADKYLQKVEPSLPTRQFLLTNAKTSPKPDSHIIFRIPLQILTSSMSNIGDFPFDPSDEPPVSWSGPTLFLKGEHSKYINRRNIPVAEQYFPNMRLEVLDAGHWVHAEQPLETVRLVQDFLSKIK